MTVRAFVTEEGVAVPAITAGTMREIDRIAEEAGLSVYQMMENAGRSLALTAIDMVGPGWQTADIVVLAGTGGNGGGGICAARHLANHGGHVTVVAEPGRLGRIASDQLGVYAGTSGTIATDLGSVPPATLVIDAVIGYGLSGPLHGMAREMIEWSMGQSSPVVSLDLPSGIDATTGQAPTAHVSASRTLTLALPKTGLDAPAVGDLWLADIGIPGEVYRQAGVGSPGDPFRGRYRVRIRPVTPVV